MVLEFVLFLDILTSFFNLKTKKNMIKKAEITIIKAIMLFKHKKANKES